MFVASLARKLIGLLKWREPYVARSTYRGSDIAHRSWTSNVRNPRRMNRYVKASRQRHENLWVWYTYLWASFVASHLTSILNLSDSYMSRTKRKKRLNMSANYSSTVDAIIATAKLAKKSEFRKILSVKNDQLTQLRLSFDDILLVLQGNWPWWHRTATL